MHWLKRKLLRWAMPSGWIAVPKEMTPDQRVAAKRALSAYLRTIPKDELAKMPTIRTGGKKVGVNLKHQLRYTAAVKAAPQPYQ